MDWALNLTANSIDDSSAVLRILTESIVWNGGWILQSAIAAEGEVAISFEFERQACVDIYTTLMAAGLELSQKSHQRMTHLCHCTKSRHSNSSFELARIDIKIMPEQLWIFEPLVGRDAVHRASLA